MEKKNDTFEYTYSASEKEEIKKIRDKYMIKTIMLLLIIKN